MDHDWLVLGPVRADVLQAELRGLIEVHLHGGDRRFALRAVSYLGVDLGTIKGGLAFLGLEANAGASQDVTQIRSGAIPYVRAADVLAGLAGQGQAVPGWLDAQCLVRL